MTRKWKDEAELAHMLVTRAQAGKETRLLPATAYFIGLKMLAVSSLPTRDEVAMVMCKSKCEKPCYDCRSRANIIVRMYGERMPE